MFSDSQRKWMGLNSAILAVFGDPVAHEDDADRAVRAVWEMHQAVSEMSAGLAERTGCAIALACASAGLKTMAV